MDDDVGEPLAGLPDGTQLGDAPGAHSGNVDRCPTCGRPTDDIEDAPEGVLVNLLKVELLRDFARGFRGGTITHQEKAILRGLLRDARVPIIEEAERRQAMAPDDTLPVREGSTALPRDHFPDYGPTDGG